MNILIILSIIFIAAASVLNSVGIRRQKNRTDEIVRGLRADIKSLLHNQKVLYSTLKELNNRLMKYEKGSKAIHQTTVARSVETV